MTTGATNSLSLLPRARHGPMVQRYPIPRSMITKSREEIRKMIQITQTHKIQKRLGQ